MAVDELVFKLIIYKTISWQYNNTRIIVCQTKVSRKITENKRICVYRFKCPSYLQKYLFLARSVVIAQTHLVGRVAPYIVADRGVMLFSGIDVLMA